MTRCCVALGDLYSQTLESATGPANDGRTRFMRLTHLYFLGFVSAS